MRKFTGLVAVILVASAVNPVSAKTLSEEQLGLLYTNCASVKLRLENIQKNDSKSRVHLGAQYESIASNLMANLNMRLVKNDRTDATIAGQHATFTSERKRFKDDFIGYSQELETLTNMDCRKEPQKFYDQLELVRIKRQDVEKSIDRMDEILANHRQTILKLREELVK